MALVLSLGGADKDFYVDDIQVVLKKIHSPIRFVLKVIRSSIDMEYEVSDQSYTEILPNVRVCAGLANKDGKAGIIKVMIEAPKSIALLRGTYYRENNEDS